MSTEESKLTALVPARPTALSKAGAKSLAVRGRDLLRKKEEAAEWLRKGMELQEAAPADPFGPTTPGSPHAASTVNAKAQLQTAAEYIKQIMGGAPPEVAAKNLRMTPEDQEMAHVAHFFMPTALDRYVSGPSKQERSASSPNASQSVKPAGSGSVGSFEELLKLDPKHVGKVETKLPTSTNTSMGIPSPAGMDDGILTQATIAKVVEIASELDKLAQDQDRKLGELEKRASALREAFQCFEKGHELDPLNPELLYWLADSYYHGNGIQQDKERATSLYQQSAHLGYAPPQTAIGDAYAQCGLGHVPSQNPNPGSKPTNPNAKGTENAPVESFEELLKLDPRQVQSITVLPRK